jgi:hypothetical protein
MFLLSCFFWRHELCHRRREIKKLGLVNVVTVEDGKRRKHMAGFGNFYELLFSFYRRLPEAILTHEIEVHCFTF